MPRHKHPFNPEQINRILSDGDQWFEKGSALYYSAIAVYEGLAVIANNKERVVGRPVATRISTSEYELIYHEILPAMLYGMAVECWLKAFLVLSTARNSETIRLEIDELVATLIWPTGHDSLTQAIVDAHANPEVSKRCIELERVQSVENKDLVDAVKEHRKHYLVPLADKCGLRPHLSKSDVHYLEFLSRAIILGRYPTAYEPKDIQPWEGVACDMERWDSLNLGIYNRCEELL